ncbi:MAG: hypothetical protein ACYDAO_09755 [Thermoplasmataceae archaeon]
MNKFAPIVALLIIVSGTGFYYSLSSMHTYTLNFNSPQLKQKGLVENFNEINNPNVNITFSLQLSGLVIINSSEMPSVGSTFAFSAIKRENVPLLLSEKSSMTIYELDKAIQYGINGVFFSGTQDNYSSGNLNMIVKIIHSANGIVVLNSSLKPMLNNVNNVNAFCNYYQNFSDWVKSLQTPQISKNTTSWSNIETASPFEMHQIANSLINTKTGYYSVGVKPNDLSQSSELLNDAKSTISEPGIIPSNWHLTENFFGNPFLFNNFAYYAKYKIVSNQSVLFRIDGLNLTLGSETFQSDWLNFSLYQFNSFIGMKMYYRNENLYLSFLFLTSNGTTKVTTSYFNLITGKSGKEIAFNIYHIGMFTGMCSDSRYLPEIILFAFVYSFHKNYSSLNITARGYNVLTGNLSFSNKLVYNGTSEHSYVGGTSESFSIVDGNILFIKGCVSMFNATSNEWKKQYKNLILYIPDNLTLPPTIPVNSILEQGGNLIYMAPGGNNQTNLFKLNLTTMITSLVFTFHISGISNLNIYNGSFIFMQGNYLYKLSSMGIQEWKVRLPSLYPSNWGHVFAPIIFPNGKLIIGSEVDSASISQEHYSQEFIEISIHNGTVLKNYYNNVTLIPQGSPPGLPNQIPLYFPFATYGDQFLFTNFSNVLFDATI